MNVISKAVLTENISLVSLGNQSLLHTFDSPLEGSCATLQLRIFPKAENVSYMALLSMALSRFLIKTLPTPDRRRLGSRWLHMIRIGRPFKTSKFIVSRARSAAKKNRQIRACLEIDNNLNMQVFFFFFSVALHSFIWVSDGTS